MSKKQNIRPTLLIDLLRNKIRIHQCTMHAMGDPDYIALIINPDKRMLGIIRSTVGEKRAHKVRYSHLTGKGQSYELNSKLLIHRLKLLCPEWSDGERYKLYGEICPYDCSAIFNMSQFIQLRKREGQNEQK